MSKGRTGKKRKRDEDDDEARDAREEKKLKREEDEDKEAREKRATERRERKKRIRRLKRKREKREKKKKKKRPRRRDIDIEEEEEEGGGGRPDQELNNQILNELGQLNRNVRTVLPAFALGKTREFAAQFRVQLARGYPRLEESLQQQKFAPNLDFSEFDPERSARNIGTEGTDAADDAQRIQRNGPFGWSRGRRTRARPEPMEEIDHQFGEVRAAQDGIHQLEAFLKSKKEKKRVRWAKLPQFNQIPLEEEAVLGFGITKNPLEEEIQDLKVSSLPLVGIEAVVFDSQRGPVLDPEAEPEEKKAAIARTFVQDMHRGHRQRRVPYLSSSLYLVLLSSFHHFQRGSRFHAPDRADILLA